MLVIEDGEITRRDKPKADCSKCITECECKEWFEHEMLVQRVGCSSFKSRSETK